LVGALSRKKAGNDSLRRKVESLLARQPEAENFMESPAMEEAAKAMAGDQVHAMVGRQLGSYRIVAFIGAGAMGEVYRADDTNLGRHVAIKILPDLFAGDPERLARFEREAKLLASLNHTNIATIHSLEQAEEKRFLVMELVEGETLAKQISSPPAFSGAAAAIGGGCEGRPR